MTNKKNLSMSNIEKRLLSISEAAAYLGIGRNSALKFLESIGAKQKIGRRVLYDKLVIDQHFNAFIPGGDKQ